MFDLHAHISILHCHPWEQSLRSKVQRFPLNETTGLQMFLWMDPAALYISDPTNGNPEPRGSENDFLSLDWIVKRTRVFKVQMNSFKAKKRKRPIRWDCFGCNLCCLSVRSGSSIKWPQTSKASTDITASVVFGQKASGREWITASECVSTGAAEPRLHDSGWRWKSDSRAADKRQS